MGVSEASREQIQFAEAHDMAVTIVDFSKGGLGIRTARFMPQGAEIWTRLDGGTTGLVECLGRVQRVSMVDREPRFYLGMSFVGNPSAMLSAIRAIVGA